MNKFSFKAGDLHLYWPWYLWDKPIIKVYFNEQWHKYDDTPMINVI